MGLRQPEAVSLGDGFKCARCDYQVEWRTAVTACRLRPASSLLTRTSVALTGISLRLVLLFSFQDVCDSRVVRYARVGRLVEDQPGEGAAAMAVIADSAAIASASAASPAAALAVDDQSSPASKRIKQQQSEQPT